MNSNRKNNSTERDPMKLFCAMIAILLVITTAALVALPLIEASKKPDRDVPASTDTDADDTNTDGDTGGDGETDKKSYVFNMSESTVSIEDGVLNAEYALICDPESLTVIAHTGGTERIYPASMTKVMTIILALESVSDLDAQFTFTKSIVDPLIAQGASRAGFEIGETVTLRDMIYGAALPSGGDATAGLAIYVSGSERLFAEKMNAKAAELGLKNTHFVNASGLHHNNHYTTLSDMATIFAYALQNEAFVEIMSTDTYTTGATNKHPEGLKMYSSLFSRLSDVDVPKNLDVICGKTGYTDEARHCLITLSEDKTTGKKYIVITAKGTYEAFLPGGATDGKYQPIYDLFDVYDKYLP